MMGGLVSMRGREGRGRRLGMGEGRDAPFLSVPRGPSGAWLGTLLRSLSILLLFLFFWVFFGGVGGWWWRLVWGFRCWCLVLLEWFDAGCCCCCYCLFVPFSLPDRLCTCNSPDKCEMVLTTSSEDCIPYPSIHLIPYMPCDIIPHMNQETSR